MKCPKYVILLVTMMMITQQTSAAKSTGSAIVGKLIPAIMKCFGSRVVGVNMNKVQHIIGKAAHGFDALDPAEIVYEAFKVGANAAGLGGVKIVLFSGKIIYATVKVLTGGAAALGTAYVVESVADALESAC
jgi:hypothetical protein